MDRYWLAEHVAHLKEHLDHFEQMRQQLEAFYWQSLQHIHDPAAKSALMESYSIHLNRQEKAVQVMGDLYRNAVEQLMGDYPSPNYRAATSDPLSA